MMPTTDLWLAFASNASAVLAGGLAMAWRLGSLADKVDGISDRLERLERHEDGQMRWVQPLSPHRR